MMHAALIVILALQAGPDTLRLDLRQAMDLARANGYQAQVARSKAEEKNGKFEESRAALMPRIGATAWDMVRSFDLPAMGLTIPTFPNLVDPFNSQDARVNGQLTLFDAAAWQKYHAASKEAQQGGFEQAAAEEDATLAASEAYLALSRTRALLNSRRSELALASQLAELSLAQKQAGSSNRLEVLRAQGQESNAKSALVGAEMAEQHARYVLLRLLGKNLDGVPVLTDSLTLKEVAPSSSPDSQGASARPEIAAAEMSRQAAMEDMGAVRSEILPTVNLAGDYGLSGRRLNSRAEWTETIALQLNWNLWDGGKRRAKLAQQAEKVRQAELRSNEARRAANEDIRESSDAMKALREEAGLALERVKMAEDEERLAREKFRSGASGNLEVISAQASVSQAHQSYIDALFGYNRARVAFLRAAHRMGEI